MGWGIAAKKRKNHKSMRMLRRASVMIMAVMTIYQLCDVIRETGFSIHVFHGPGHLEKVYENALAHRLRKSGRKVLQQHAITVRDEDGTPVGEYFADLFIDDRLIVELKAAKGIADEHIAQLLGYLKSTGIEHGLLINFGGPKFLIKKYAFSPRNPCDDAGF